MKINFTDKNVKALKVEQGKEKWISDTQVHGLCIRVRGNTGHWFLRYMDRNTNKQRKLSLCPTNGHRVADVRELAMEKLVDITKGSDPIADRKFNRDIPTVREMGRETIAELVSLKRVAAYTKQFTDIVNNHINPALGDRQIMDVEHVDLVRFLRAYGDTPRQHNFIISVLSRIFKLSLRWGYAIKDPTVGLARMKEGVRKRVATDDELAALLREMDQETAAPQSAALAKMVIFTACRPSEAFQAKWEHFDLDAGVWIKPAETVKTGNEQVIELGDAILQVLRTMNPNGVLSGFVFPGPGEDGHLTTIKKSWAAWCRRAGITDLTLYDMRRTLLTKLMGAGVDLKTVMSISNHATPSILLKHYVQETKGNQRNAFNSVQNPTKPSLKIVAN